MDGSSAAQLLHVTLVERQRVVVDELRSRIQQVEMQLHTATVDGAESRIAAVTSAARERKLEEELTTECNQRLGLQAVLRSVQEVCPDEVAAAIRRMAPSAAHTDHDSVIDALAHGAASMVDATHAPDARFTQTLPMLQDRLAAARDDLAVYAERDLRWREERRRLQRQLGDAASRSATADFSAQDAREQLRVEQTRVAVLSAEVAAKDALMAQLRSQVSDALRDATERRQALDHEQARMTELQASVDRCSQELQFASTVLEAEHATSAARRSDLLAWRRRYADAAAKADTAAGLGTLTLRLDAALEDVRDSRDKLERAKAIIRQMETVITQ